MQFQSKPREMFSPRQTEGQKYLVTSSKRKTKLERLAGQGVQPWREAGRRAVLVMGAQTHRLNVRTGERLIPGTYNVMQWDTGHGTPWRSGERVRFPINCAVFPFEESIWALSMCTHMPTPRYFPRTEATNLKRARTALGGIQRTSGFVSGSSFLLGTHTESTKHKIKIQINWTLKRFRNSILYQYTSKRVKSQVEPE